MNEIPNLVGRNMKKLTNVEIKLSAQIIIGVIFLL